MDQDMEAPPAALGLTPRKRLTGGHRNTVWLCDGPDGPVIAKSTRRTEDQIRWVAPLQDAARTAGLVIPTLKKSPFGHLLHQNWILEPWIEGRAAQAKDMPALAPRIRAFHAACPALSQRPGFCTLPELVTRTSSGDVDLSLLPADILAHLRAAWATVRHAPTQPIHGDLGPGNLILTDKGPCLIDWDESRVDLPALDLIRSAPQPPEITRAHLALEIASCWQAEPAHARHLLARFGLPGNTAP